jgi:hypothetical protein
LQRPLRERRERLRELLGRAGDHLLSYSDGVVGCGCDFFAQVGCPGPRGSHSKALGQQLPAGSAITCLEEDQAEANPALRDRRLPAWTKRRPERARGGGPRRNAEIRRGGVPWIYRPGASRTRAAAQRPTALAPDRALSHPGMLGRSGALLSHTLSRMDPPRTASPSRIRRLRAPRRLRATMPVLKKLQITAGNPLELAWPVEMQR